MILSQTQAKDQLLFVYEAPSPAIELARDDAVRALTSLCQPRFAFWITSPPRKWLIEVDDYAVRLAIPPSKTDAQMKADLERQLELVRPLLAALQTTVTPHSVFLRDDERRPQLPGNLMTGHRIEWQRGPALSSGVVGRGDVEALRNLLQSFLSEASFPASEIAVHLDHSQAPVITLPRAAFLAQLDAVMSAADRWDESGPGEIITITSFLFHPIGGRWLARVFAQGRNWRLRAIG